MAGYPPPNGGYNQSQYQASGQYQNYYPVQGQQQYQNAATHYSQQNMQQPQPYQQNYQQHAFYSQQMPLQNQHPGPSNEQRRPVQNLYQPPQQMKKETAQYSGGNNSNASSFQKRPSPLNDFGDMGAAVQKYADTDPSKPQSRSTDLPEESTQRPPDNNVYRRTHGLTAWDDFSQNAIPEPFQRFEDFKGLNNVQLNAFYNAGFQNPTPIQAQTWPMVLQGRDIVSIAKTGSGKTLAFLLPGYKKIDAYSRGARNMINVLVLAPTRELATQIQEEAVKFGNVAGYYSACAYGGAPKRDQLRTISSGISVLVATPGRLNDFIDSNQVDLSSVVYLVLDEADRMLDMGFEPQIRSIIRRLPKQRQTLMFSATWPEEVRRLASDFLYQPIHVRLGNTQSGLQANEDIQQHLILLPSGEDKDGELVNLIRSKFLRNRELVLIFVARKNTCDFVANMLNRVGISAAAMHGDRDQNYREKTLAAFRDGSRPIMVATDVASRGIDVRGISAVINYDLANSTEDYVHRIGRTGRAGMAGESFTFLTHSNDDIWKAMGIVEVMEKTGQYPRPEVQEMIDRLKQRQQQNKERRAAEDEQFSKVLIVAEKPSVAKMIAEHLSGGRFRTRRGQSRANQIFELIKWFPPAQQKCKLMVTSVVGHIFGLNFEGPRARDIAALFDSKVEKIVEENTKKLRIVEHLQELAQESDYLYLWLDCDREGENIGFEVISLTQQWIHYDNVYRARFSALTQTELVYAYENPVKPDKYAAMSVDARQELDLKIGVAFSRLMTKSFLDMAKEKFRLRDQRVVSYGPCQTPTLWFCVQRHREIQRFRPVKFYVVSVVINFQGKNIELKWVNDKTQDQEEIRQMEVQVRSAQQARIVEVVEEQKTFRKPLGLNTVTLLKACSKGLGMSPTAAMHAAEHLYTSGYISYPRTETSAYPPSFDLVGTLEEQCNHPNWGRIASYILRSGRVNPPDRGQDVGDHPPITPMRCASREEFNKNNEWRIYDYVTRHFIGSLHDDMSYTEKKMLVDINGYQFHYTWHEIIDKGFVFAMPWKIKGLRLNEDNMPPAHVMQQTQVAPIVNFTKDEEFTKPPDYLQESELIALMDKHGIGTDASIPQHIKNVNDRHYVDVCGPGQDGQRGQLIPQNNFFGKNRGRGRGGGRGGRGGGQQQERPTSRHMVPRGFGLAFLSCFDEIDKELCEPTIRGYMEQQVCKIATGETEKSEVVNSNLKLFQEKFRFFRDNLERVQRFFAPKGQGNMPNGNFGSNSFGQGQGGGSANQWQNNSRGGASNRGGFGTRGNGRGGFANRGNDRGGFANRGNDRGGFANRGNNRGDFANRGNDRGGFASRGSERGGYSHRGNDRGGFRGASRGDRGNFGPSRGGGRGQSGRGRGFDEIGNKRGTAMQSQSIAKRIHHSY